MLNRIKETVESYLNTDGRGNFNPQDFENITNHCIEEIYKELFFEVNRLVNRQNRGLINSGLENLPDLIREQIQHYLVSDQNLTYLNGEFLLPTDYRYSDYLEYNGIEVDMCKSRRDFKILKNAGVDETYPIGIKSGTTISILPDTITDTVSLSYLRNPKKAKWTFNVVDEVEIFNPSSNDFEDADIHPSLEGELTIAILKGFGINLKEKDIQAITQREDEVNFNQENKI
jgi:hypothetical protein